MSERYQISSNGDGTFLVIDTVTDQPVLTNSRDVYAAPEENAQWTADRLNRAEDRKNGIPSPKLLTAPAPVSDTPSAELADWELELLADSAEPDDFDRAQAELAQEAAERAGREIDSAVESTGHMPGNGTLESRLEPTESVLARLTPMGSERQSYAYKYGKAQMTLELSALRARSMVTDLAILREQASSEYVKARLDSVIRRLSELAASMDPPRD